MLGHVKVPDPTGIWLLQLEEAKEGSEEGKDAKEAAEAARKQGKEIKVKSKQTISGTSRPK